MELAVASNERDATRIRPQTTSKCVGVVFALCEQHAVRSLPRLGDAEGSPARREARRVARTPRRARRRCVDGRRPVGRDGRVLRRRRPTGDPLRQRPGIEPGCRGALTGNDAGGSLHRPVSRDRGTVRAPVAVAQPGARRDPGDDHQRRRADGPRRRRRARGPDHRRESAHVLPHLLGARTRR